MIIGYVLMGLFGVNLLYVLIPYLIRHDGMFFLYNPNFGRYTNSQLALQIIESVILMLIAWGIVAISKKRLRVARG